MSSRPPLANAASVDDASSGLVRSGPHPIFVLGCPRSGTTLWSTMIGQASDVCDMGEFAGHYFVRYLAPAELRGVPGRFVDQYLDALINFTEMFAEAAAKEEGASWYVDGTPWNMLVADELAASFPSALFVLCLRHYKGIVQSLQRAYWRHGYPWAGETVTEAASLWARFYSKVPLLPANRTIPVSYDQLCANPNDVVADAFAALEQRGINLGNSAVRQLAVSHAVPPTDPRPTVASVSTMGDVQLHGRPAFDPSTWSPEVEAAVQPLVKTVHQSLKEAFPDRYQEV